MSASQGYTERKRWKIPDLGYGKRNRIHRVRRVWGKGGEIRLGHQGLTFQRAIQRVMPNKELGTRDWIRDTDQRLRWTQSQA